MAITTAHSRTPAPRETSSDLSDLATAAIASDFAVSLLGDGRPEHPLLLPRQSTADADAAGFQHEQRPWTRSLPGPAVTERVAHDAAPAPSFALN